MDEKLKYYVEEFVVSSELVNDHPAFDAWLARSIIRMEITIVESGYARLLGGIDQKSFKPLGDGRFDLTVAIPCVAVA